MKGSIKVMLRSFLLASDLKGHQHCTIPPPFPDFSVHHDRNLTTVADFDNELPS